jgi:UDP-2,3-diacylglucosamine pyrophosphatase LpxH
MRQAFDRDDSHRTVFVSDTHLGARGVQAGPLLEFLRTLACDHLYLIGDIIDFWQLRRGWGWTSEHGLVLAQLLEMRRRGVRITYIPGNHDAFLRGHPALEIGGVVIAREAVHEAADGRRFLVVHGDQFDRSGRLATIAGDFAAAVLKTAGSATNGVRRAMGLSYHPLGSRLRRRLQHLVPYVARFESSAAGLARSEGLDGIICGHIHIPALKEIEGVVYANTGDWVDSCTAIGEHASGALALVDWPSIRAGRAGFRPASAEAAARNCPSPHAALTGA